MRTTRIALLVALSGVVSATAAGAQCLHFEPAEVQLSGTLSERVFPGPPNYESIAAGDRAEQAFILVLDEPICVVADPQSDLNSEAHVGIHEVHVRWFGRNLASFVGKQIVVHGRLSTAILGHDRTPVVLGVTSARAG